MAKPRPKTSESISTNLKRLMEVRNMTQTELAKLSGVSQTHIGGILRRESSCTIEMADALAHPFGLSGWQIIMPNLPADLLHSNALKALVHTYIDANTEAREFVDAAIKMAGSKKK